MINFSGYCLLCLAALDISGGATLRPFLPIIAEKMGAAPLEVGFIASLYSIIQIFCGPIIGTFSDQFGRKRLLLSAFLFSMITPLIVLVINLFHFHYYFLYVAIIPMSIFRHSQTFIKSMIIDEKSGSAQSNDTLNMMAKWSCFCYVGSAVGPLLISLVGDKESVNAMCIISAFIFLIALILAFVFIKNDNEKFESSAKRKGKFSICNVFKIKIANKQITHLITYHFLAYFSLCIYRSGFVLILKHKFGFEMQSVAFILSYKSIIGFVVQTVLTKYKLSKNEFDLLWNSTLCLALSMIGFGLVQHRNLLFVVLIFSEIGESLFRTSFQAVYAFHIGNLENTQTLLSLLDSSASFNRSIAPMIFAMVPEEYRYQSTTIVTGCLYLCLLLDSNVFVAPKKEDKIKQIE